MSRHHTYDCVVTWTGNRGSGTRGYRDYDRTHDVAAQGRPTLPGSADPAFRGEATRWNPEMLLVASLSQCHMLWYLHLAADAGVVVTDYVDQAMGTMVEQDDGSGQFVEVVLRPAVTVTQPSEVDLARQLHDRAHATCFIARSVNFPVRHEPTIVALTGGSVANREASARHAVEAAVRAVYERYLHSFTHNDLDGIDAVVSYPLTHVGKDRVRVFDTFPINPADLKRATGWHTTLNSRYEVVATSSDKAHVVRPGSSESIRAGLDHISGLSFKDPDGVALEFFAPPA